jgi:hypothetical protein
VAVAVIARMSVVVAQQPVKLPEEVERAAVMGVPLDPQTRVDPARMPGDLGRRALEALGLREDQLAAARAATYSPLRLEDAAGRLAVYYSSLVKQGDRWVFWSEDLPRETTRQAGEVQVSFDTARGARYLVDFVMDSAPQEFAVVAGETRTTRTPVSGHLALIVEGTGREQKVRALPLGDSQFSARRFTLFHVTVTPLM